MVSRLGIIVLAMIAAAVVYSSPASAIVKAFMWVLLVAYAGIAFLKEEKQ